MEHPDYNSPQEIKSFLEENGMAMQKKFGQNFLLNEKARNNIIDLLECKKNETVWEVGPGLGCMTELLLKKEMNVCAFEIDRGFIKFLHEFFKDYEERNSFKIVEGDVLKTWKKEIENKNIPSKLFGNLPYNIAATFIADTITNGFCFEKCVFTVQKEVAKRMCSAIGKPDYSSFTVLCNSVYDVKLGNELAAGNFWPKPNVASQTVIMKKKEIPYEIKNKKLFYSLIHTLFSSRRKTIANNIKSILPPNISCETFFAGTGIDSTLRAEALSIKDFIVLSEKLASVII